MAPSVARAVSAKEDNDLGTSSQRTVPATTSDKSVVGSCHRGARAAMQTEIEQSGVPRKVLAGEVANGDESLFSKMVGGTRPFDLNALDALPRPLVVAWLKRYGAQIGVKVADIEPAELTERLLTLVDELASVARLSRIVGKPVKATLR